ncbi:MAG: serine/threonine protein kinase [Oscillospiraceae bacterium]|jgi:serine/threonine-protein kinase|nr:serine/threonine protein kinase [Oscillospiraceae bacterium]
MLETGALIGGKYRVLEEIGRGGMSVVYAAVGVASGGLWAVKEVRKDGARDLAVTRRSLRVEMELLRKLSHPSIPGIADIIERQSSFLIVMDYMDGAPLSRTVSEQGAQPPERVIRWAKQLCDVLGYLHSRAPAIIYRDIKPSNIILRPDGSVALIDFGAAREFKTGASADTANLGTAGYAAPEQFGGRGQTDVRTDVFCLGATLRHLLTGIDPTSAHSGDVPPQPLPAALPVGLKRIVERCARLNPEERYQSCAELLHELDRCSDWDGGRGKRRTRRLAALVCSLTAALLLAFLFKSLFRV